MDWEGHLQLFKEELRTLAASDLRAGLEAEAGGMEPSHARAYVVSVPRGNEEEYGPYEPVSLEWDGMNLHVVMLHTGPSDGSDEEVFVDRVRQLLQPFVDDRGGTNLDVEFAYEWAGALDAAATIRFSAAVAGPSVGDLFTDGMDALRLCGAFAAEAITRESFGGLVVLPRDVG